MRYSYDKTNTRPKPSVNVPIWRTLLYSVHTPFDPLLLCSFKMSCIAYDESEKRVNVNCKHRYSAAVASSIPSLDCLKLHTANVERVNVDRKTDRNCNTRSLASLCTAFCTNSMRIICGFSGESVAQGAAGTDTNVHFIRTAAAVHLWETVL